MINRADVLGAILAGGTSRRMGRDKSLLPLGDLPLIGHVARVLRSRFHRIIIVSDFPDKYRFLDLPTIPDLYKGIGPLGGIHAALSYAQTQLVFTASCDIPLVPPQLVDYLLDVDSPERTRLPLHNGVLQPLFGLYEKRLLPSIEAHVVNKQYSVAGVLRESGFAQVEITPQLPFFSSDIFCNANSPDDFARIQQLFRESASRSVDTHPSDG